MYLKVPADRVASIGPWICICLEATMRSRLRVTSRSQLPWPASYGVARWQPLGRQPGFPNQIYRRLHLDAVLPWYSMFHLQWSEEANSTEIRQGPRLHGLLWSEGPQLFLPSG